MSKKYYVENKTICTRIINIHGNVKRDIYVVAVIIKVIICRIKRENVKVKRAYDQLCVTIILSFTVTKCLRVYRDKYTAIKVHVIAIFAIFILKEHRLLREP